MIEKRRNNFETALMALPSNKYKVIFEIAPIAIVEGHWQKTFNVMEINNAALELFKARTKKEFVQGFNRIFSQIHKKILLQLLSSRVSGKVFEGELFLPVLSGRKRVYVLMRMTTINHTDMSSPHVLLTFQDLTNRKRKETELKKLTQLDSLTKIFNHKTIIRRLEEELWRAKRYRLDLSCVLFDLDSLKKVNDSLGHQFGDKCIKQEADALKAGFRKSDYIGRYGGDEFLVILPETRLDQASVPVKRFLKSYEAIATLKYKAKTLVTSFSVGISGFPLKGIDSTKKMIAAADEALYLSKKSGGNKINTYLSRKN
jgi:diguanylate cyclase (GGDEF)-like protein